MIFQNFIAPFRFAKSSNIPKNMAKIEEKSCSTCLKPISPWHFANSKPGFKGPNLSLSILYMCATSKNDEKKSTLPKKILHAHNGKCTREKNSKDDSSMEGVHQQRHNEIIKG